MMDEPSQGGHPNNERSATMTMDWLSATIRAYPAIRIPVTGNRHSVGPGLQPRGHPVEIRHSQVSGL